MNLDSLIPLKQKLEAHPIFERINSVEELKIFIEESQNYEIITIEE